MGGSSGRPGSGEGTAAASEVSQQLLGSWGRLHLAWTWIVHMLREDAERAVAVGRHQRGIDDGDKAARCVVVVDGVEGVVAAAEDPAGSRDTEAVEA